MKTNIIKHFRKKHLMLMLTIIIMVNAFFSSLISMPRTPSEIENIKNKIQKTIEKKITEKYSEEKNRLNQRIKQLQVMETENAILQKLVTEQKQQLLESAKNSNTALNTNNQQNIQRIERNDLSKLQALNKILKEDKAKIEKEKETIEKILSKQNKDITQLKNKLSQTNLTHEKLTSENNKLTSENKKLKIEYEELNKKREENISQIIEQLPKSKEKTDLEKLQSSLGNTSKLSQSYGNLLDKLLTRTLEVLVDDNN